MASVSANCSAWLQRVGLGLLILWRATIAVAHPMPESTVWIDTTPGGMNLTAQLPLNRLEFAFGRPLTDHPETVLARYGDALSSYLLLHVGARSEGKGWLVLRPKLDIVGARGYEELQASFTLQAPANANPRAPQLLYDVITHEVRTHRVQVFLRTDWESGFVAQAPLLIGELNHGRNLLFLPLGQGGTGRGVASLVNDGMSHIAGGTDHLLFLFMLLIVAPLTARDHRWRGLRPLKQTLRHTAFVVTAFTVGHTITLVLGSAGLVVPPEQPVEVAVALTILVTAIHAWRPLFARAESRMALCFGLVHGMAFSSSLAGAGLTPWQHAQALFAFNLGIETMQLVVVAVVLPALLLLGLSRHAWLAHARRALAAIVGLMACAWVAQRTNLVDLGEPAWLADGGTIPVVLICLLWLGAVASVASTRLRRALSG